MGLMKAARSLLSAIRKGPLRAFELGDGLTPGEGVRPQG